MAQEGPNILQAAALIQGGAGIVNSRGFDAASFQAIGAGHYKINLVDPVDPTSVVCLVQAYTGLFVPLIGTANIGSLAGVYFVEVFLTTNAGVASDGAAQLIVQKFATDQ